MISVEPGGAGTAQSETTEADAAPAGPSGPDPSTDQPENSGSDAGAAPAVDTAPTQPNEGCQKIDFLFVVDNSPSMKGKQQNLADSFKGFISVVQDRLQLRDYHVMAVDTDASRGQSGYEAWLTQAQILLTPLTQSVDADCSPAPACCRHACGETPTLILRRSVDSCNGLTCEEISSMPDDGCEGTLGSGKRLSPDGQDCGVLGEVRYMGADQPQLEEAFTCVARVGTSGDGNEQPMAAMLSALSPALSAKGSCNEGFLRDDAILVVTFITDEDDVHSVGNPDDWRRALLSTKGGNEDAVVVLGLVGDDSAAGGACALASPTPRLREFTESLRWGEFRSVCAADYTPFFETIVSSIYDSCRYFTPPSMR